MKRTELARISCAFKCLWAAALLQLAVLAGVAAEAAGSASAGFPLRLSDYPPAGSQTVWEVLKQRVQIEPFNLVGTGLFFLAILHTFLAPCFTRLAHRYADACRRPSAGGSVSNTAQRGNPVLRFKAEIFHLLGEVEAIFGIWVVPLMIAISLSKGWGVARDYLGYGLSFTEPMFVVVIMAIAASRPILEMSERLMALGAALGKGRSAGWWFSILTIGPVLGSFITEPAAMTISALLLAEKFYQYNPSAKLAYATLGLLFVNVSVGGTLTHFAAPPVLMVAGTWGWGFSHMLMSFGWKAVAGIVMANLVYFAVFRKEFGKLDAAGARSQQSGRKVQHVPLWITVVHLFFLGWTVLNSHYPVLFLGGFLCYLAFTRATEEFQKELALRPALLVGFFLAGLVVHGGLQGWWIGPVLGRLPALPLFFGAAGLTAFNDNAAITYLASLVPDFSPALQHAVVAGAVVGGGLTVIANAPNPAGQSILSKFFPDGVSALGLFLGAILPTIIVGAVLVIFLS